MVQEKTEYSSPNEKTHHVSTDAAQAEKYTHKSFVARDDLLNFTIARSLESPE